MLNLNSDIFKLIIKLNNANEGGPGRKVFEKNLFSLPLVIVAKFKLLKIVEYHNL
jgi:hypothetical protein